MSVKGFKTYDRDGNETGMEKYDYHSLDNIPDTMLKDGGKFNGNVVAYEEERTTRGLFNEETRIAKTNHTGTLQKVKYFINEI